MNTPLDDTQVSLDITAATLDNMAVKSAPELQESAKIPAAQRNSTRRTLADSVRSRLAEEIINGTIAPGTRLDEHVLAARFNVSRTPVREALRQLTANGLVEWRPRHGAVVASISVHQMVEMFEVMAELEGFAGRLAARRMTDEARRALRDIHDRCRPFALNGDRENYHRMNRRFHVAIYEGSHNPYLAQQATALYDRLAAYRAYELNRPGEILQVYTEHGEIIDALSEHDGDRAYRLLKEHAMLDSELLGDLMATLQR